MAEPLTSQAWVAAWLAKADHDLTDLLMRCGDLDESTLLDRKDATAEFLSRLELSGMVELRPLPAEHG